MKLNAVPLHAKRHSGQTVDTGAPAERDQQRLDLIIRMLRKRDMSQFVFQGQLAQRHVTRTPRRVLGTFARCMPRVDTAYVQGNAKSRARDGAMRLKVIRGALEPVVNMNRVHLTWPAAGGGMKECRRIRPATVGHREWQWRRP